MSTILFTQATLAIILSFGRAALVRGAEVDTPATPAAGARNDDPTIVILNKAEDLNDLIRRIRNPDLVILKGDQYRKLRDDEAGRPPGNRDATGLPVVTAIETHGRIRGDVVSLTHRFRVESVREGGGWAPIRLDGLPLLSVKSRGADLPTRSSRTEGWSVEIAGAGPHVIDVEVAAPIITTGQERRFSYAVPNASTNSISLEFEGGIANLFTRGRDPSRISTVLVGGTSRATVRLSPRDLVEFAWATEANALMSLPPLIECRGEYRIEASALSARVSAVIEATVTRGDVDAFALTVAAEYEILDLEVNGKANLSNVERIDGSRVSLRLAETARPGTRVKLGVSARRQLDQIRDAAFVFSGFSLKHASTQSGSITISELDGVWTSASPKGPAARIRRVSPEQAGRPRPGVALAFEYVDTPFSLELAVRPARREVLYDAKTVARFDRPRVEVETEFEFRSNPDEFPDLILEFPDDLAYEKCGPASVVASTRVEDGDQNAAAGKVRRIRIIPKTPRAGGDPVKFTVSGWCSVESVISRGLPFFRPADGKCHEAAIRFETRPGTTVKLDREPIDERMAADSGELDDSGGKDVHAGFRSNGTVRRSEIPERLPVAVETKQRMLSVDTAVLVDVNQERAEFDQPTRIDVSNGSISSIDVLAPPELEGAWEIEGADVSGRAPGDREEDGRRHYRVSFSRPIEEETRIRFRYRIPLRDDQRTGKESALRLPWIRVEGDGAVPDRIRITTSSPGIRIACDYAGWERDAETGDKSGANADAGDARISLTRPAPAAAVPTPRIIMPALVRLPSTVIPRMLIRSVVGSDGGRRVSAWYHVESRLSEFDVTLPPNSRLVRIRVGGNPVENVPGFEDGMRFRIPLGPATSAGVLVNLDYETFMAKSVKFGDLAPKTLGDAVIRHVLWDLRIPDDRVLVGTPSGWSDENEWYWDLYLWKRKPIRGFQALANWAAGSSSRVRIVDDGTEEGLAGYHSHLFGSLGEGNNSSVLVASKFVSVALFSGLTALLGIVCVVAKPARPRSLLILAASGMLIAFAIDPDATLLAAQSSLLGILLTVLAASLQGSLDRRGDVENPIRQVEPTKPTSSLLRPAIQAVSSSSPSHSPGPGPADSDNLGAEDPTAIRAKPASTAEHVSLIPE